MQSHCYEKTFAALNAHADEDGRTSPTVLEIMRETKQSERTIRRHLSWLRQEALIFTGSVQHGRGLRTTYEIQHYNNSSIPVGKHYNNLPNPELKPANINPVTPFTDGNKRVENLPVQENLPIKDTPSSPSSLPPLTLPSILSSSLPPETNINAPTHARSSALNGKVPEWLQLLRELPKWSKNGAPYEKSLLSWAKRKGYSVAVLEASAIGLGTAQEKTFNHYTSLKSAFQRRVINGYDRPASTSNNGYVSAPDDVAAHREAALQDEERAKRRRAKREKAE